MKRKAPVSRFVKAKAKARARGTDETWHNGADVEIHLYARSLQKAAKALVKQLGFDAKPGNDWDVCPIISLYRQALEIHVKAVVGEGSNFLASPTDHITPYKTHSLRWLAQIVCQIIKAVRWENEFSCEGVSTLAEFSALVNQLEALEPVSCAVHADKRGRPGVIPAQLQRSEVAELFPKLDALIDLLAATADGLAATWDQKVVAETDIEFNPTIH
jgi:hypothetical protein